MAYSPSNECAFPYGQSIGEDAIGKHDHFGLTKREYAAIHIAAGMISQPKITKGYEDRGGDFIKDVAISACRLADAVLLELERTSK